MGSGVQGLRCRPRSRDGDTSAAGDAAGGEAGAETIESGVARGRQTPPSRFEIRTVLFRWGEPCAWFKDSTGEGFSPLGIVGYGHDEGQCTGGTRPGSIRFLKTALRAGRVEVADHCDRRLLFFDFLRINGFRICVTRRWRPLFIRLDVSPMLARILVGQN
jgi:hypothetical protein